jgi:hypothetical protein
MAEGVGFEPTVRFPVRLISSQVPSTAQPPFLFRLRYGRDRREAEEHSEKVRVVEDRSGRMGDGAKRRMDERSKPETIAGMGHGFGRRPTFRGRVPSEPLTANRKPPTGNGQPQTLIDLFPFGVRLALAEEFVVVGDLVHQHSYQADHVWPHCIEPLGGFDEQNRRAQEMTGGDNADSGIHPTYN